MKQDLGRAWSFTQDSLAEITDTCEEAGTGKPGKSLHEAAATFQLPIQPGPEEEGGGEGEET